MVTATVDSSSHSPTTAADSPTFPRKNLSSPWAQVVRGADSEPNHQSPPSSSPSSSPSSLDTVTVNSNTASVDTSDAAVKPAWKRPTNGVAEVGPVMGAVSWPPLSESTKTPPKVTSEPSTAKTVTDDGSLPSPQGPVTSDSSQKQASSNVKPNPAMNHGMHNRQRQMKRGSANSNGVGPGPVQNNFSGVSPNLPPPPPPPFPVLPIPIPPGTFAHGVPGIPVPSPRDTYRNNNWDTRPPVGGFMPPVNDHRTSSRRGNAGHHPRGDGPYHNSYGNRRDQDRGNYANTRDAHVHQPRMPPRGLMRAPVPNPGSFMGPQPLPPFANPGGFPEFYYFPTLQFESLGGMPFFTHAPPAMFYPVAETPLTNTIVNQIDYYFSNANLVKDEFLRSNMDEQGWVSINLIASFPRVKSLTSNIELILDSLKASTVVEVKGDKLRRRNDWIKWLPSTQLQANSGSASPSGSSCNNVASDFGKITLDEATADKINSESATNGVTGESSTQSQLPNGDAMGSSG
ncbi:hypothetical protein RJT34_08813 [Clitoria ternatea]|uniref:HTH La-type RNA-binding domain-containing protein n=1 Tax=Clitoria ternatea TaxID=43366 RepID=A0AAN9PV36_CLITE